VIFSKSETKKIMAVAILAPSSTIQQNMKSGSIQNQLTRSLERILEEANLSGELKLSGRKLKDFPKGAGKYDLRDTVIAGKPIKGFFFLPNPFLGLARSGHCCIQVHYFSFLL
jgi:hypothetical protein